MIDTWYKIDNNIIDLRANFEPKDFITASRDTVNLIMNNYKPPYYILVTGGLDSQVVLYSWKLFGDNYIPTSIRYNNDFNKHDLVSLEEFSKILDINIEYVNFDVLSFFKNYKSFANQFRCVSPHFAVHLAFSHLFDGTVILSGDRLQLNSANITWENMCLYQARSYRSIVPYFLLHTPQIAYSMYHNPVFLSSASSKVNFSQNYLKYLIYKQDGIPVICPKDKFTGFEKIKEYFDNDQTVDPLDKLRFGNLPSKRNFDLLFRYPYSEKFKGPKIQYILN